MTLSSTAGLAQLDGAACAEFRARLLASGYHGEFLSAVEGIAPNMLQAVREPLVKSFLARNPGPSSTMAALFGYSFDVSDEDARAALGDVLFDALARAGVLVHEGGRVRSPFTVMPLDRQWFLSDPLEAGADAVMGPGMTTLLLHRWLTALPCERMLDLGCGAASLAIAAAATGARAVAADITGRALEIAAFNARLNGVEIETRLSDVGSALRGERFDLVLSQPPYVALPESGDPSTYLHGGRYGDELAMRFVSESARLLAPGGTALLLFDSAVRPDAPLPARLKSAIGDAPVAQLALVLSGASLDQYAIFTAGSHHPDLGAEFARSAVAYREHFDALGVTAFSRVILVLRRPAAEDARARYSITLPLPGVIPPTPDQLVAQLDALDLAALPDELLLGERVRARAGARFVGEWDDPGAESPARLRISFPPGSFATDRELGQRGWLMFGLLDGSRTVSESVPEYAAECDTAPEQARAEVLGFVREGLMRGLLRGA